MRDLESDPTPSTSNGRVLWLVGGGLLVAALGLGVLIGRSTVPPAPPPVSVPILSESTARPPLSMVTSDEDADPPASSARPAAVTGASPSTVPRASPAAVAPPAPVPAARLAEPAPTPVSKAVAKPVHKASVKPAKKQPDRPPAGVGRALWIVQLGAFQSSDHATLLVYALAAHGQAARVVFVKNDTGAPQFLVQTPPYESRAAAKEAARTLAAREHVPTYLIKRAPAAE